jgi:hypothetical protein
VKQALGSAALLCKEPVPPFLCDKTGASSPVLSLLLAPKGHLFVAKGHLFQQKGHLFVAKGHPFTAKG